MKAVILVGTGTPPHSSSALKARLPLLNNPLIRHQLRILAASGVSDVILFPASAHLQDYFRRHPGDGVKLSFQAESRPGGLVLGADAAAEPLVVLADDVLPGWQLAELAAHHRRRNACITAATCGGPDMPAGVWIVSGAAGGEVARLVTLLRSGERASEQADSVPLSDGTIRIRTADDYAAATRMLLGRLRGDARGLVRIADDVWGDGPVFVDPDATLAGPVLLGRNCSIAAGATVLGPAVLGDASMVCRNATVENSIIGAGAAVGACARITDSIITECFTIGPGAAFDHSIAIDRQQSLPVEPGSYAVQHSPRGVAARV